jgi:hypothetical protein
MPGFELGVNTGYAFPLYAYFYISAALFAAGQKRYDRMYCIA